MRSSTWIADDDQEDRDLVAEALNRLGNTRQVHTFENGLYVQDAFLSPNIHNPKYLIVASRMPKLGGLPLVQFLLERKLMSRRHMLLWSGAYSPLEQDFCSSHQLICRQKPVSFQEVVALINEIFSHLLSNKTAAMSPNKCVIKSSSKDS